jgi:hypothetical protein
MEFLQTEMQPDNFGSFAYRFSIDNRNVDILLEGSSCCAVAFNLSSKQSLRRPHTVCSVQNTVEAVWSGRRSCQSRRDMG